MCETCRGRGKYYNYENSITYVIPCPNEPCRLAAQERSKKEIQRIKAELARLKEESA
ncbi:hypothetical protein [Halobacillus sp. KGW1]|uniref:hypothetical protein n=1 Tax=Halobacillus sp. KGW1 TaxID=1793726 RepID=UPI000A907ABA|nr:hypothetical protein [Halobacillus sp. KGW1]